MADLALDIACVACWHRVIPSGVLEVPRHGFLNVHPSLLPALSGAAAAILAISSRRDLYRGHGALDGFRFGYRRHCCSGGWCILPTESDCPMPKRCARRPAVVFWQRRWGRSDRGSWSGGPSSRAAIFQTHLPLISQWISSGRCGGLTTSYGRSQSGAIPFRSWVDGERQWFGDAIAWHDSEVSVPEVDGCVGVHFRDGVLWAQECPGPTR